jgi:hypothetical protein
LLWAKIAEVVLKKKNGKKKRFVELCEKERGCLLLGSSLSLVTLLYTLRRFGGDFSTKKSRLASQKGLQLCHRNARIAACCAAEWLRSVM